MKITGTGTGGNLVALSLSLSLFKVEGLGKFLLVLLFSALVAHT